MLKWAVNGARQSYLPPIADRTGSDGDEHTDLALPLARQQRLKRKSSELFPQRQKLRWSDKENLMASTSTPLHSLNKRINTAENITPLRKTDSLKDISNILLENMTITSTFAVKTPESKPQLPRQYASTLPTFDAEYSPNGLIPGPILALRGLGVPDAYFDKPRYLTQADMSAQLEQRAQKLNAEQIDVATPKNTRVLVKNNTKVRILEQMPVGVDESTLSSSKMGDMTLERMIDAILESTRKERKYPRYAQAPPIMSPTYTAAEDPASDLKEYWNTDSAQYMPTLQNSSNTTCFNEREVRNSPSLVERLRKGQPHAHKDNLNYQLRRQRAVRRKRQLGKIGKTMRSSAHKLALSMALSSTEKPLPPTPLPALPKTADTARNISPDSGHNSTSDLDEFAEEQNTLAIVTDSSPEVVFDATKRRLSFTHNNSNITVAK